MDAATRAAGAPTTEDVLAAVASAPYGDEVGRFVLGAFHTLRIQGRSRLGEDEVRAWARRGGLDWEALHMARVGHVGEVLARGPRSTADVALVEAWVARGLAARLSCTPAEGRLKILEDLVPVADHMRLLTPYDPYRMVGSFLDRSQVVSAFEALTDAVVRDARALSAGRSSRLRAVITQRLESLVRVLPPELRAPLEARVRNAGGDASVPLLLDAALGVAEADGGPSATPAPAPTMPPRPGPAARRPAAAADGPGPAQVAFTPARSAGAGEGGHGADGRGPDGTEVLEGAFEVTGRGGWTTLLAESVGISLLLGVLRLLARGLLGLRRAATLRAGPEGLTVVERTFLLGRNISERSGALGPGGLTLLRVERRTSLFLLLSGLLAATAGAGVGLYLLLDGIRGEYAALVAVGLLVAGGGIAFDLLALHASERMGSRASLVLRTADGHWLRVGGLDHARAMRFAALARGAVRPG